MKSKWSSFDEQIMWKVLKLALKGRGRTSPNPMVGAIIVKNRKIVGEGWHKKAGEPHAEILAMQAAGEETKDATLYINLEPCCHYGKTPPCVDQVIKSGISRVIISTPDPNPQVAGRSIQMLNEAKIKTEVGLLQEEAQQLNEAFFKYITTGLPFVILKLALSMDGKIATKTGDSKWITSEISRNYVHRLRDQVDASCVGIGTILRDNSRLTTRLKGRKGRDPIRVVIDSLLKIPLRANVFAEKSNAHTIIVTTNKAFFNRKKDIEQAGGEILIVNAAESNKVNLSEMAHELGKKGIISMMIEGGAEIAASALQAGIVDKIIFFMAPKIVGGKTAPGPIGGPGIGLISDAIQLHHVKSRRFGEDILIEAYIKDPTICSVEMASK